MSTYTSDGTDPATTAAATLRPAGSGDTEAIASLWHQGWADGHLGHVPPALLEHRRLEDFRRRVPPRLHATTVALRDDGGLGRLAGFVMLHGDEVEQLYVAAAARGGGVADVLIRHAERTIAARSRVAWLAVAAGNARARRFYERSGWRDAGPIDYAAEVTGGTLVVPCRRYEKRLEEEPWSGR